MTSREFASLNPPEPRTRGHVPSHDGTRIWYETYGHPDRPALVLTDGIVCNGTFFAHLIPYLEDRLRIVRWAYRGHGPSEAPASFSRLTMEDCIRDLWAVMDETGVGSAVHLGYSMGVQLVIDAAARRPDRVGGMVLMCGAPGRLLDTFHGNTVARSLLPLLYSLVLGHRSGITRIWRSLTPTKAVALIASATEMDGRLIDREQFLPYLEHLASLDIELVLTMLASAADHDARHLLPSIRQPSLVLGGRRDSFTPFFLSEAMYEALPDSELCGVPGATHCLPIEQPDLVNLRIEEFLLRRGLVQGRVDGRPATAGRRSATPRRR